MEVRKVQKVGYSTLTVSLPKEWIQEKGLKAGDIVTFVKEDDGGLKLYAGIISSGKRQIKYTINADLCKDKGLISRIITGSYITAADIVEISSRRELSQENLTEIRNTVQKLNGLGIVEQSLNHVILQCFIDPKKFPFNHLLKRLYIMTSSMLFAIIKALQEKRKDLLYEVLHMEDEVDKIYWLAVRQLVLAAKDRELGKSIGIENPAHVVGNRVILMNLEEIGDLLEDMAQEAFNLMDLDAHLPLNIVKEITDLSNKISNIYDKVISAFLIFDLKLANKLLEEIDEVEKNIRETLKRFINLEFTEDFRILLPLRSIIWNLGGIAGFCGNIAEITINRSLEFQSSVCKVEEISD